MMETRSKGKMLRIWFVCGLCLCALLAAKWLFFGDAAPRLRLVEEVDCVSGGKPVVVCRMVNRTVLPVRHGSAFYVERWNETAAVWEVYDESTWDVNFTLPLYTLRPFGSAAREYPVWIYGEDFAPGRYRVVQEVRLGRGTYTDMALTCEFAVAAP